MEFEYAKFTPDMKKTHKLLIPNMAPVQFTMVAAAMRHQGFDAELLGNSGSRVAELGQRYVHNDTCYPALLVIGQFIDALQSGKYDPDHVILVISQTGGGCRASNYIYLLRKALYKAGFGQVPVASFNFSGLDKSGYPMTLTFVRSGLTAVYYGDLLCTLRAQTQPYELHSGDAEEKLRKWLGIICKQLEAGKGYHHGEIKKLMPVIAADFASIPVKRVPKVKVGVVGEIYVKYSPMANNDLEEFLRSQDCEVNLPGLMGFLQYCCYNPSETARLYGGTWGRKHISWLLEKRLSHTEKLLHDSLVANGFHAAMPFNELSKLPEGIIGMGVKMGEGWLLTAEMIELVQSGYENIICAQPFGCLPNHISGKGMINKIRDEYPNANITPIDYDPGATKVNQENRIKLMLAVAKERLEQKQQGIEPGPVQGDPMSEIPDFSPVCKGCCDECENFEHEQQEKGGKNKHEKK
jgi:predicted nucleotide-binding protein (sugar kinase/HSP70/actin superfamily)